MRLRFGIFVFLFLQGIARLMADTGFPFQLDGGLIWIQVSVPQSLQPLEFIVDSGAEVSVINLQTALRLGLSLGTSVGVHGVKCSATGYWPERLSARAGTVSLPNNYLAVDLRNLSNACGRAIDGLLGADFFRGHLVHIDFVAKQIRILETIHPNKYAASVPLKVCSDGMRVPLSVNHGKQQWMRLDTGCASALQWVNSEIMPDRCSQRTAVGITKMVIPQIQTTVRIGNIEFATVPTGLQTKRIFAGEAGLLGCGLLSRFSAVTVDAAAGRLLLDAAIEPTPVLAAFFPAKPGPMGLTPLTTPP